jgi:hypothetical protein
MAIGFLDPFDTSFNLSASIAQAAIAAARPAFELQFFRTQEAILDRLNKDIENVQDSISTKGATALLDVQIKRLQNNLELINDYKTRTDRKASRVSDTLSNLTDLISLAAPGTVAEFDAKLTETISLMQTTKTPIFEQFGVQDRLRKAKTDGLAQVEALVHNNFATQTDIDNTTAILTAIQSDYTASQTIIDSNTKIAFTLQQSKTTTISELSRQVSNIKTAAIGDATDKVKAKQEQFSQLLTALSLAFEASQEFTNFVVQSLEAGQNIENGSVFDIIS